MPFFCFARFNTLRSRFMVVYWFQLTIFSLDRARPILNCLHLWHLTKSNTFRWSKVVYWFQLTIFADILIFFFNNAFHELVVFRVNITIGCFCFNTILIRSNRNAASYLKILVYCNMVHNVHPSVRPSICNRQHFCLNSKIWIIVKLKANAWLSLLRIHILTSNVFGPKFGLHDQ